MMNVKYFGDLLSTTYFEHMTDFRHLSNLKWFSIVTRDLRESETVAWDLNNVKLSHFVCISPWDCGYAAYSLPQFSAGETGKSV